MLPPLAMVVQGIVDAAMYVDGKVAELGTCPCSELTKSPVSGSDSHYTSDSR